MDLCDRRGGKDPFAVSFLMHHCFTSFITLGYSSSIRTKCSIGIKSSVESFTPSPPGGMTENSVDARFHWTVIKLVDTG